MVLLQEPFGVKEEGGQVKVHFFTSSTSRKFQELRADPRCAVLFWNPETITYVLFQGRAEQKSDQEANAFWRAWMALFYKDAQLYTAWHLNVDRVQVVSIGRFESLRKDWRPMELERSKGQWQVVCDGTE
ncbi:unnamed protein product [Effrenium voratum]|nr:unnamed protein product [Effrenium voratum]